ncbi:endothelial differentiation-related factor 1 isoform X2 [Rhinoderma darwinii]|uniref:endothelial differentiation-related factor 1 isoform X2 n=1 Tax=Rhinoderma darwinii TaxID=43563 RepID=UPI003F674548
MAESDWDTVTVLRKKGPTAAQAKSKQAVIAAQRRGEELETSKKWSAGQNKQHVITKNTAKLDRETEELHHDRVTLEVGKVIQQGRQGRGLTQKDLATKINEKPQVIADYEVGKAIPSNQVMGKIERAIVLHSVSGAYFRSSKETTALCGRAPFTASKRICKEGGREATPALYPSVKDSTGGAVLCDSLEGSS